MVRAARIDVAVRDRHLHGRPLLESPQRRRHLRTALGAKGGEEPSGRSSRTPAASEAASAARRSVSRWKATRATTETARERRSRGRRRRGRSRSRSRPPPRPTPAKRSPRDRAVSPRTCSNGRASARPRSRVAAATRRAAAGGGGAARTATAVAAPAPTDDRARRSHAATADGRQVGIDPADARRGAGQGARVAAPARARVRVDPVADGVHHGVLGAGEGAAARPRRRQRDAEPVEGAVVLPRPAGAVEDVQRRRSPAS